MWCLEYRKQMVSFYECEPTTHYYKLHNGIWVYRHDIFIFLIEKDIMIYRLLQHMCFQNRKGFRMFHAVFVGDHRPCKLNWWFLTWALNVPGISSDLWMRECQKIFAWKRPCFCCIEVEQDYDIWTTNNLQFHASCMNMDGVLSMKATMDPEKNKSFPSFPFSLSSGEHHAVRAALFGTMCTTFQGFTK